MTVVGVSLVDTGLPRTSPLGILVGVAGRVLWQWRGFDGMPLVHLNGSARPWVLWCGYSALPLQSVCVKSIDSRVSWAQVRSRSHYQVSVEMEDKPNITNLMNNVK